MIQGKLKFDWGELIELSVIPEYLLIFKHC